MSLSHRPSRPLQRRPVFGLQPRAPRKAQSVTADHRFSACLNQLSEALQRLDVEQRQQLHDVLASAPSGLSDMCRTILRWTHDELLFVDRQERAQSPLYTVFTASVELATAYRDMVQYRIRQQGG